jgi:methionine synthase I (cobalamin-dependent)
VAAGGAWCERVGGLRANASCRSHAELNDSTTLDSGDPVRFGAEHAELWGMLPRLSVLGGCCGTDSRHIAEIAEACAPLFAAAR